jgi:hypothetical protein
MERIRANWRPLATATGSYTSIAAQTFSYDITDYTLDPAKQYIFYLTQGSGRANTTINSGTYSDGSWFESYDSGANWGLNVASYDMAFAAYFLSSGPSSPGLTSAAYNADTGVLVVTGTNLAANGSGFDIDVSLLTITGESGSTYSLTDSSDVEITSSTAFSVTLSATDKTAFNQIFNKNGTASTSGTTYNLAAANNWNTATSGAADLTGNGITVSNVPDPAITSATYNAATGALVVTGTGFLSKSGAANDIDVSKLTIAGQAGGSRTLTSTSVEITSGTSFSVTLNSADQTALQSLLNQNGTSSSGGTTYNLAAAEDWAAGADAAVVVADLTSNGITVSNYTAPSSSGGGGGGETTSSAPNTVTDTTPADPAPAGTNIQTTDDDGDGLREVITAADGVTVDGNRDGVPDIQQTEVAGLRLINDGAAGSDYGALVVNPGV